MKILSNLGSFKTLELFNCELFIDSEKRKKLIVFTTNAIIEIDITKNIEIVTFLLYEHISLYNIDKKTNSLIIECNNDMIEVEF